MKKWIVILLTMIPVWGYAQVVDTFQRDNFASLNYSESGQKYYNLISTAMGEPQNIFIFNGYAQPDRSNQCGGTFSDDIANGEDDEINTFVTDGTVSLTITAFPTNGSCRGGVVFRCQDGSNYWIAEINGAGDFLILQSVDGVESVVNDISIPPFSPGDNITIEQSGNDLTFYYNYEPINTETDSDFDQTGTYVGMVIDMNGNCSMNVTKFSAFSFVPAPPAQTASITPPSHSSRNIDIEQSVSSPQYSDSYAWPLTQVASTYISPLRIYQMMISALKAEIANDPQGMGYSDMSVDDKKTALRQRATDVNPLTCVLNFGFPFYLSDTDLSAAGVQ
jgi:hypothetical protein